jgi:methionine-rich copper-binding protein CopC
LALGILIAGPTAPALAHTDLVVSTPTDGAQLATVPDEIQLTFSEDLLPESVVVSVADSAGMVIRVLELEVDGSVVTVTWPPGLSGTDYTVNYRVVSQDGHPVTGSVSFTVDSPPSAASAVAPTAASTTPTVPTTTEPTTTEPTSSSAPAIAAIAAGLAVGIAVALVFLLVGRRRGPGAPTSSSPDVTT